jgi:hypothetical protein
LIPTINKSITIPIFENSFNGSSLTNTPKTLGPKIIPDNMYPTNSGCLKIFMTKDKAVATKMTKLSSIKISIKKL